MIPREELLPTDPSHDAFATLASGLRLCYRRYGSSDGEPLLLIAGVGLQLISWPRAYVDELVARGFSVTVFDNRDVGRSSRIAAPPPSLLREVLFKTGANAYDLTDMARDVVMLMDELGLRSAHLLGASMGGMIAQTVAANAAGRVRSLCSLYSSTGAAGVGQPSILSRLGVLYRVPTSRAEAAAGYVRTMHHIAGRTFDIDVARSYAEAAWDRGDGASGHAGFVRQVGAILKSGDRTARLAAVRAPTLVLHGDVDTMVSPSGGRATAKAISGARHLTLHGLRHHPRSDFAPMICALVAEHACGSERSAAARFVRSQAAAARA